MINLKTIEGVDIKEINNAINAFNSIDINQHSENEIVKFAKYFLNFLDKRTFVLKKGSPVYRARKNSGRNFTHISQLWYPEPKNTKLGRCNFHKSPVFYGSLSVITTRFEINIPVNELLTHIELITNKDLRCFHFGPTQTNHPNSSLTRNYSNNEIHKLINYSKNISSIKITKKTQQKLDLVTNFLCELFITNTNKSEKHYLLTSFLSQKILDNPYIDAIFFPSVQSLHSGMNIVLSSEKANEYLELKNIVLGTAKWKHLKTASGGYKINLWEYAGLVAINKKGHLRSNKIEEIKDFVENKKHINLNKNPKRFQQFGNR